MRTLNSLKVILKVNNNAVSVKRFRSFLVLLLTVITVSISADVVYGQVDEFEEDVVPSYQRPEHKVFKSLVAALNQPDSVFILELRGKKYKEFPEDIFKLKKLLVLDLGKNKIKFLPENIGDLTNLIELDVSSNKLSSLPSSIGELKQIRKIALNRNVITKLPPEIGDLRNLEELELWDNELEGLPSEIGELQNLRILEIRGILFSPDDQFYFKELLPETNILMSPPCNCK